jgi:hypothetical protein
VLPTFLALANLPSAWMERLGWEVEGLSPIGLVHGKQFLTIERSIPVAGRVSCRKVLRGVYDKGSGALVVVDTELRLEGEDRLLGEAP